MLGLRQMFVALVCLVMFLAGTVVHGQEQQRNAAIPDQGTGFIWTPAVSGGAVSSLGPGDLLQLTVYGHPELSAQITVTQNGDITVPFLGPLDVAGQPPSAVARRIEHDLQKGGYLNNPKVLLEVLKVRSHVVSVLGEVQRPGNYAIEGRLSMLELLAMAGGLRFEADENVILIRKPDNSDQNSEQTVFRVGGRGIPAEAIADTELQAGDVVYVPTAARFFIYGQVGQPGAYPIEKGMNVMRAISLAGGLNDRASDRRISIKRTNTETGATETIRARLDDALQADDVVFVDERWF